MIQTLSKVGIEGTNLNIIKEHMTKPQPTAYLMGKTTSISHLRLGTRQG